MLTFTVYNYLMYTFSIPFGPLFLLWVAVLGMCIFALIGGVTGTDHRAVAARDTSQRAVTVAAWSLIVIAVLFGLLWLSEDVPALLAGVRPQGVTDMALPTNPVHILDLAFFLPAVIASGVLHSVRQSDWAEVVWKQSKQQNRLWRKTMSQHSCEDCPMRKKAEAKPKSLLARLWRWHTTWCPGWKAYQKSLAANQP